MKKTKFLLSVFMAIVMMAMSTNKAWAEEDPRLSALTLGEGVTATITDEDGSTPWVVTTEGEELYEGPALPADYVPGLRSDIVDVHSGTSVTIITLTSEKDFDLSFKAYCSTEGVDWDYMQVFVDGQDEAHRVCMIGGSSDNVYTFSQTMTAGTHTLRLYYGKDDVYSGGYDCGFIYNFMAIGPCNPGEHNLSTHVEAKAATCTEKANVEYWQCSICNHYFSDNEGTTELSESELFSPALGHDLDANGECTRCDYSEPIITEGDNTIQIGAVTGDKSEASGYQLYRYVPAKSGKLTVKSSTSGSGDTFGSLWNSDLSTRLTYDDDSAGGRQFLFTYDVTAQTVYYIGVRNYGGGALSGDYVINVDLDAPCDIDHHTMTPHEANNPTCSQKGNYAYYECSVCGRLYSDNRGENLLSGIPYIPALGHVLDEDKLCSRCGKTITQLEGTELDISSKDMPIHIYSTYVEYDDNTRIDNTGNLILTGTPGAGTYFYIHGNPADGQIVLRDLDFTLNGPLFYIANSPEIANIYVEGDVTLNSTSGGVFDQYCSTPKVSITGPGNLTMTANGNSHVLSGSTSLDIDIIGDLVMSGQMSSYSSSLLNAKANTITISQLTSEPFMNMSNTTLQAKGDIVVDCNGTSGYDYTGGNQVYLFQGLSSTEGTVRFRAAIGTDMEYCAVKVGDPVPSPSSSAPFAAYTKKIVHTNGFATYYNTLPSGTGTLTYNGNRPYLTLTKDLAGNTVFDMDVFKSAPIEIYDGYLTNAELRSCWDGHPVFTGTATEARFLRFNETLSAANTPILRELTLNVSSWCLSGSNVVATIDGNVSMSGNGDAINATNSCTITGNGSLTLSGTNRIYGCPDMNIDITGDLVGSNTGAPLNSHNIDFSKLKANSITFRIQAGSNTEHAIFMPTPATTPAASDPNITYTVKGDYKDGYTIWCADYKSLMEKFRTNLDGDITILDDSKYTNEAALSLSDAADFDISGYTSATFCVPSVSYERTMSASNWGTIMMPFELHSNSNVQYYIVTAVDLSEGTMTATPVNVVYPGHPCLFKRLTSDNLDLSSNSKTLVCTDYASQEINNNWELYGTYTTKNLDATADSKHYYYISADQFWHAKGTVNVKPYRAYFIGEAPASSVKSLTIMTSDGEETRIEAVMDSEGNIHDAAEGIYDMQGRKLNSLQKGINIVNGKKVVVK